MQPYRCHELIIVPPGLNGITFRAPLAVPGLGQPGPMSVPPPQCLGLCACERVSQLGRRARFVLVPR